MIAVAVSAACFGTLAVLTPLAYDAGARPLPLLAWRFVLSSVLIAAVALVRDRAALMVPAADLARYAALALTGYGAASVCFFFALTWADAAVVAVLLYTYPALVTLGGWALGTERPALARAAAVAVTFTGCALVVGVGSSAHVSWQGVVLGLGAAVGYTLFNLLSHRWLSGRSRLTMMAYTFGIATVLPAAGAALVDGPASLVPSAWGHRVWVLLITIVLVPTFLAVVLYLEGIRGLGPSQAAVLSTLEPVFTIVLAHLVLDQAPLTIPQVVGAALVLGGVVAAETAARGPVEPPAV